jgi:hypothetical protein
MGWVILAISMIFFLIVGDIDSQQNQTSRTAIQTQSGQLYASQILTIANRVNDWRYKTGQNGRTVPVDQLGLPFTPDAESSTGYFRADCGSGCRNKLDSLMPYGHRVAVRHSSAP